MTRALGRYELLRPLARGGMAEVFVARRRAAGVEKVLVIKRIRPERAGDPRFLDLFVREARLSMTLTHQNIVPVFDFGRAGTEVFLAMERVEGRDLGSSLERAAAPPPPLVAAFVAAECCQALGYAHRRRGPAGASLGVVHRDVTPRNVLVSWSGEVKLVDFGIAALAGDEPGRPIGTPAYMAPEQARGDVVDARADLYGLGLVLRELLTGVRARPGSDRGALIEAARVGALGPWTGDVPEPLRAIVDRATALDRDDRFASASEFGEALDGYLVAARAAAPGDAPARQLAAWMDATWQGARDEVDDGAAIGELADDGTIGSDTARSLAATADEVAVVSSPPASPPSQASGAPASAPTPRRRRPSVAVAVSVVAVGAMIAMVATRPWSQRGPGPVSIDAGAIDAGAIDAGALDARVLVPGILDAGPLDAGALDAGPHDAGAFDARGPSGLRAKPADAAIATAPVATTRQVRINARPWATVAIDDDPTEHETIFTIRLAPGPHRLRFRNPQLGVDRTIVITVPDDRDLDHIEDLGR